MENMTDYQFKSFIKMILAIVEKSKDVAEVKEELEKLLDDGKKAR